MCKSYNKASAISRISSAARTSVLLGSALHVMRYKPGEFLCWNIIPIEFDNMLAHLLPAMAKTWRPLFTFDSSYN